MTSTSAPKLTSYVTTTAVALTGALVFGLPELAALAAPFAVVLGIGLASRRDPGVEASLSLTRERVLQGERVGVNLEVESAAAIDALEIFLRLPFGLSTERNPCAVALAPGEPRSVSFPVRCERWGGYVPGEVFLRARDRLGVATFESRHDLGTPLKVYPREEEVRALLRPSRTRALAGNEVARAKGEGIEFADVRPFVPGDQVRRINWRASARHPSLWVNEAHPEQNADIVLFVDSFTDVRRAETGTLDLAVRAAMSLARLYLRRHDRVGLVSFGGVLRWLVPSTGVAQLYRVIDALLETEIALSYAWKGIDVIPPRTLPPGALVVALSPLVDERSTAALLELGAQGFDLAVIEISPLPFVEPAADEYERIARRLWALRRETARRRFQDLGIPVAVWSENGSFTAALEEVTWFRRAGRRARV